MARFTEDGMRNEIELVTAYIKNVMGDAVTDTETALQFMYRTYGINLELRMSYAGKKRGSPLVRLICQPATVQEDEELGMPPIVDIWMLPKSADTFDEQFVSAIAMWGAKLDRHMRGQNN